MDAILTFFTETLTGPWYIVYVVVLVILIFACIGYLSERAIYLKKQNAKYAKAEETVTPSLESTNVVSPVEESVNENPSLQSETVMPVREEVEQVPVEPIVPDVMPISVPLVEQKEPPVAEIPVEGSVLQTAEPPIENSIPAIPMIETESDVTYPNDEVPQVSSFPSREETVEIPEVIEAPSVMSPTDLPK